jgi:hypothetical protein
MAHQTEAIRELLKRTEAKLGKYQNSHAQSLLSETRKLFNAVDGIASMRSNPNSLETPAAHALKINQSANKLKAESIKAKQKALDTYVKYSADIDMAINNMAGIKENNYASEIRAAYRALPPGDRMDFLKSTIDKKDGETFAAIMFAPQILTGVDTELRNRLTDSYYLRVAPELYQEREDLKEAMDGVIATIDTTESICNEYNNPEEVRKIEAEVQKAQEAASKFNEAMG